MDLFGSSSDEEDETTASTPITPTRPPENGVMQFHTGTEQALLVYVTQQTKAGDSPEQILKIIDTFCEERHWMMHIGSLKVEILRDALLKRMATFTIPTPPTLIMLELGTYCGYSAIQLCSLLRTHHPTQPFLLYSLEISQQNARVARSIIDLAGFSDNVKVFVTHDVEDGLVEITKDLKPETTQFIDLLFIDHDKDSYLSDLQLIIKNSHLNSSSVVIADNVIMGRIDDYLEFVREEANKPDGLFLETHIFESTVEYCTQDIAQFGEEALQDGVEVSVFR
ncbi:hypothetical protein TrLO_g15281 [Triparma laevis f. longispina]|uniref:catechol O-methyltransferase n=1 Tax=Triparma laevis f. longispina TaxID=1714387 RepID=A0A9W7FD40_9STRA|nr:hypothetical protein TrLO_g15281 [Triparma laevis f. longispina]